MDETENTDEVIEEVTIPATKLVTEWISKTTNLSVIPYHDSMNDGTFEVIIDSLKLPNDGVMTAPNIDAMRIVGMDVGDFLLASPLNGSNAAQWISLRVILELCNADRKRECEGMHPMFDRYGFPNGYYIHPTTDSLLFGSSLSVVDPSNEFLTNNGIIRLSGPGVGIVRSVLHEIIEEYKKVYGYNPSCVLGNGGSSRVLKYIPNHETFRIIDTKFSPPNDIVLFKNTTVYMNLKMSENNFIVSLYKKRGESIDLMRKTIITS